MLVSSAAYAQSQTKSITPDPYFGSSQSSLNQTKKPATLTANWETPINSRSATDGSATKTNFPLDSIANQQRPTQSAGFGLSPLQQPESAASPFSELSSQANSTAPVGQSVATPANTGTLKTGSSEPASKPRPKSLIVQASPIQNTFGGGQGSTVAQVDHQEKPAAKPFKPGKVLALVGGEPIFVGDLMFQVNQIIEEHMANAPEDIKEKQRQLAIPQLLPRFIESKLLYQGAVRKLPDGVDLEAIFTEVGKQFEKSDLPKMMESAGVKSVVEFDARLRGQDYSLRQLKRNWAIQQFTRHSIGQAIGAIPETTHQEMLDRYEENLASYEKPGRAKWEQILVRFDRTASRSEAKRMIVEIGNQIVHGANFAATAKKRSHGYNAANGGKCDWTTQGALALDEIDKAIFSLPIGELSDLIETKRGFHIVRVTDREQAGRTSFLDAQIEIKKEIQVEKRKAAFEKYAAKLREEIPIEYLINE